MSCLLFSLLMQCVFNFGFYNAFSVVAWLCSSCLMVALVAFWIIALLQLCWLVLIQQLFAWNIAEFTLFCVFTLQFVDGLCNCLWLLYSCVGVWKLVPAYTLSFCFAFVFLYLSLHYHMYLSQTWKYWNFHVDVSRFASWPTLSTPTFCAVNAPASSFFSISFYWLIDLDMWICT